MSLDLTQLNPQQRAAVEHQDGPLLVLAGAGSGKTRVVTCRTARLLERGIAPRSILVVTFTNKAAGEMRDRILSMVPASWGKELTLSTFHALGARLLRQYIGLLGYSRSFTILDESDQLRVIRTTLQDLGLGGTSVRPEEIRRIISLAKRERTTPAGLREFRYSPLLPHAQRMFAAYQENLKAMGGVDFDDLLALPLKLCAEDQTVRQELEERYQYVMVDEFQDTNAIQLELLRILAARQNLVAVGDDDQSIYGFQGAKASNILEFDRIFPGASIVKLEQNYRSTGRILEAANSVIAHNQTRHHKELWSVRGAGERVRFITLADEREEAGYVVADIGRQLEQEGLRPADFAILYRVRTQSRLFEEALRLARIPYRVVGSTELFKRTEVRDWIAYLTILVNPRDDISFRRLANVPRRGLSASVIQILEQVARSNRQPLLGALGEAYAGHLLPETAVPGAGSLLELIAGWSARMGPRRGAVLADLAAEYLEATGLIDHLRHSEKSQEVVQKRLDSLRQLVEGMRALDPEESLADYLAAIRLESTSPDRESPGETGVRLLTLHSAKGLEFRRVYLVGFERELIPHSRSLEHPASIAEERRLCYVGMTRAQDRLTLTAARTRTRRDERIGRQPSMFLAEIPEVLLEGGEQAEEQEQRRARRNREYLAQIRALLEGGK
ncbi:MAG: UvrD-helicase domain-containing protein [Bradymonadales bacterium]|nr:UvrD-helicase domain-containing protein [Bradymonadales bacterium]